MAPANSFTILAPGDSIGAWTVTIGYVDLKNEGYWEAEDGVQSIDLSGSASPLAGVVRPL